MLEPDSPRSSSMVTTCSLDHPSWQALSARAYWRAVDSRLCSTWDGVDWRKRLIDYGIHQALIAEATGEEPAVYIAAARIETLSPMPVSNGHAAIEQDIDTSERPAVSQVALEGRARRRQR